MSYMLDEIHEQPAIIERVIGSELNNAFGLCRAMKERGINAIGIASRGTSDNAATLAKYVFEIVNGVLVALIAPSVFTLYRSKLDLSRYLILGISQSGESTDVVEVLRQAREMGALTAGITNAEGSSLANVSDYCLLCRAGEEKSIAATKTYTSTLALIYLISSALGEKHEMLDALRSAAVAMASVFSIEGDIAKCVERYRYMSECMVTARGLNQATCQEAALKLEETCYVVANPLSAAEIMHGPIAVIEEGFPVFLYAPQGRGYDSMFELSEKLAEKKAEMIVVSTEDEILEKAKTPIKLPISVNEVFSPLVYIVAGQLFAQYLSLAKGYNPDNPRGLSKVTRTM